MATPEAWALGKLDGRNADSGAVEPHRPVQLYRKVTDSGQRTTARTGGPKPGQPWNTPSALDELTVLAEDLSVVYVDPSGKEWTLSDMVIELFKAHQAKTS
ncbi:hypothetical protein SEA_PHRAPPUCCINO_33 [Mycobacterium phage Phrappuccino]|uniref:Uncharacterized protein n=1 Tax=Mycobacterium phage Phrappuccino TaxID=2591223 RepID=A0A514DDM2_9CAUD|nr:hypothetical protein KHQ87_gp033 [Mycobacterium phage Phrappuccino]QDH91711.1 hypothetical protein SEA_PHRAPPUCCINO_33 [Mycobacterium phage Phrappuccino]QIQ63155.1 hypothetical protein SEA_SETTECANDELA_33 [Mycobacterium phage Settecandela]